jgi:unsaturated rhamnogalacturonyl hydrolase
MIIFDSQILLHQKKRSSIKQLILVLSFLSPLCLSAQASFTKNSMEVIDLMKSVNYHWQNTIAYQASSFWHHAAYHTGNMEAYALTGITDFKTYSENWAKYNNWKGATSNDTANWKYTYGESSSYVLFGDWQICFQTYADLFNLDARKDSSKIARARGVMEYEMKTAKSDYWWWADGLYMVMPVMTKLYNITGNRLYLEKLRDYFKEADKLMFDTEYSLYYRDAKYVYPLQPTINGKKNFWARGDGWVFAGMAKVLKDLPENDTLVKPLFTERFKAMAKTLKATQQTEGYWTRSILDPAHAPGYETSGTAFFCYGFFWGINHGLLPVEEYLETAIKSWNYLQNIAVQPNLSVGYVQPIGENASPNTTVSATSTANFGVGAFLLAAAETSRYLSKVEKTGRITYP